MSNEQHTGNGEHGIQRRDVPAYIDSAVEHFGADRLRLLRDTIARDLDLAELGLFIEVCKRTGLDPFARQIYAVKRYDKRLKRDVMNIQTGIDGFRTLAERTAKYVGQRGPFWCGDDGQWTDVWLKRTPPAAAKVEVLRKDFAEPLVGIALWEEYAQRFPDGNPMAMWGRMPSVMIAKCAEAIALRRAFPQELSGIYTSEEMAQAEPTETAVIVDHANVRQLPAPQEQNGEVIEVRDTVAKLADGKRRPGGATASQTLIGFMSAIDSIGSVEDLFELGKKWTERLEQVPPRGRERANAYFQVRRARLSGEQPSSEDVSLASDLESIRPNTNEGKTQ